VVCVRPPLERTGRGQCPILLVQPREPGQIERQSVIDLLRGVDTFIRTIRVYAYKENPDQPSRVFAQRLYAAVTDVMSHPEKDDAPPASARVLPPAVVDLATVRARRAGSDPGAS
jgi:hypothetical protein